MSKIVLAFLGFYFFGLAYAFRSYAIYAFYVYQIVYFLNPADRWWGKDIPDIPYSFISVVAMFAAYMLRKGKEELNNRFIDVPVFKWLFLLVLMYYFMWFFAILPDNHMRWTVDYLKMIVIVSLAYKCVVKPWHLHGMLYMYMAGATYIGYLAFSTGRTGGGRVEGIGTVDSPDANGIAAAIAPSLLFALYYAWMGSPRVKAFAAVCGVMVANGIVLINSRGSFLGVLCGAMFFFAAMFFSSVQLKGQRLIGVLVIVAGAFAAYQLTDDVFWERMSTLKVVEEDSQRSGSERIKFWMMTFTMLRDNPMGLGAGGYAALSPFYLSEEQLASNSGTRVVHSSWFQVLGELGWQGALLCLCLLGSVLACFRRLKKELKKRNDSQHYFFIIAIQSAFITYLVSVTFINQFRAQMFYWLILFVACAYNLFLVKHFAEEQSDERTHGLVPQR